MGMLTGKEEEDKRRTYQDESRGSLGAGKDRRGFVVADRTTQEQIISLLRVIEMGVEVVLHCFNANFLQLMHPLFLSRLHQAFF